VKSRKERKEGEKGRENTVQGENEKEIKELSKEHEFGGEGMGNRKIIIDSILFRCTW
jgi:hypothetical protein